MNYLWNKFSLLSRFKQIGIVVLGVHFAIIVGLFCNHLLSKKQHRSQSIAIRTINLPRTNAPSLRSNKTIPQKTTNAPPIKTHTSNVHKPSQTTASSSKTIKKQSPSTARLTSTEETLLQQLSNSLDALSKSEENADTKFAVSIPAVIEAGILQTTNNPSSQSYGTAFTAILQNNLDLPEFGTVTAKIEINPQGKITALEILDARSQKNSDFLKKRLQELTFPCFNEFGLSEKHLNFTVTFRNVETY